MLNKELLLATESQIAGYIKLTVGEGTINDGVFGYISDDNVGSINRIPTWNKNGNPIKMITLLTNPEYHNTVMVFDDGSKVDANRITMTVVEKELTVVLNLLNWDTYFYNTMTEVFDPSDRGKTFTIVFDPEPTGYV